MRVSRFTIRQLATTVSLTTIVMASTVLAVRQAQRYVLCAQLAESHVKKERAVMEVVGKMKWYVKEHNRYEMPRQAVEAEKMAGWFQRMASYHSEMSRKYRYATWRPWEPVPAESP